MDKFAALDHTDTFDILDENGEKLGETETYNTIHAEGLLHKTVHVWVLNSKSEFLLQKRSKYLRSRPLYWDNSASGHVLTGQTSLEAAQTETKEELGLSLLSSDFE